MDKPKIYVACLAAYNDGVLHGKWIDANQCSSDIYEEIYEMLASSPIPGAEEFAVHDFEGFGRVQIHEYESIETIAELAAFITEHNELGSELLGEYSIEEAVKLLEENYYGSHGSEVDFAYEIFENCYSELIPENLQIYFDFEALARDLFICDYFSVEVNGRTHVFSNY